MGFFPSWRMQMLFFSVRLVYRSVIYFHWVNIVRLTCTYERHVSRSSFFPIHSGLICFALRFSLFSVGPPFVTRTSPRPSPAALFYCPPRFPFVFRLAPYVPRTSSRPSPAAIFCFSRRFPLSANLLPLFCALVPGFLQWLCFVQRSDFRCIHAHIRMFPAHILLS